MNTCVISVNKLTCGRFSLDHFDTSPAANMNSGFQASAVDTVQVLRGLALLHYMLHVVLSVCVCDPAVPPPE